MEHQVPQWAVKRLQDAIVDIFIFSQSLLLFRVGLETLYDRFKTNDWLLRYIYEESLRVTTEVLGKDIEHKSQADTQIELAHILFEKEIKQGFPFLRSYAVIYHWGMLEDLIHSFLSDWISHNPAAMRLEEVVKADKKFAKMQIDPALRHLYIVDEIERRQKAKYYKGVARFEKLLEYFNLDGEVHPLTEKYLLEMHQVRNVIVHRQGVVDQRLIDSCPWIDAKVGERLYIDYDSYRRYFYALHDYILVLLQRVMKYFGVSHRRRNLWEVFDALSEEHAG